MRPLSPLRSPRRGLVASLAALAVSAAVTLSVLAAPPPARVTYEAPPSCPSREAFVAAVRADLADGRITESDEPARLLAVDIARAGDHYRGRLTITELDGATSTREVNDATCEGVVAALTLITSLAILAPPPAPTTAKPTPSAAPTVTAAPTTLPIPTERPRVPTPTHPSSPALRFEIGAHGGVFGAVAPGVTFGALPFLGWSAPPRTGFSPSLRLGAVVAQSLRASIDGGEASFRWFTFRAGFCPAALAIGPFAARPCVGADLGAVQGEGSRVRVPLETTRFWGDVHLAGRLQWSVTEAFVIELDGGAMIPLQRYEFGFDMGATPEGAPEFRRIHLVPPIAPFGTLGIGVVFP